MPPWTPSYIRYPQEEWTWRGIVNPSLLETTCLASGTQILDNSAFNCGVDGWGSNEEFYPATITDNGNGSVHLRSDTDYGSIIPLQVLNGPLPVGDYELTIIVGNITGASKASIRNTGGTWASVTIVDGTNVIPYTGDIDTINVGADNDAAHEADYYFYGLKEIILPNAVDDFAIEPGDTVMVMTWTEPDDIEFRPNTKFGLYMTPSGTGTPLVFAGTTTNLTEQFTGLENGTTYDFGVTVFNSDGEGPMRNVETGTPEAAASIVVHMGTAVEHEGEQVIWQQ